MAGRYGYSSSMCNDDANMGGIYSDLDEVMQEPVKAWTYEDILTGRFLLFLIATVVL